MKFKLHYTHSYGQYKDIEINTLEELLKLVEEKNCGIIVDFKKYHWNKDIAWQWTLEVYDDYRE